MANKVNYDEFKHLLKKDGKLVADFYSDSCVACKRISPLIAEVEEETENVKFVKINVNFEQKLAEEYDVMALPTLVFFENGVEKSRHTGIIKKQELIDLI